MSVKGYLIYGPEVGFTTSGVAICNVSVATSYYRRPPEGKFILEPGSHPCTAFKDMDQRIAQCREKIQRYVTFIES